MSWFLLIALGITLSLVAALVAVRRAEFARLSERRTDRFAAITRGSHKARLQFPQVDLTRCVGCGTCVRACPEEGVLALIHGQAQVVHGARCVGHGRCAAECPTGAIAVELDDLERRRDIPVLAEDLAVPGEPGLFLAGEVTGFALIKTAIGHGTRIADAAARLVREAPAALTSSLEELYDLVIVGAGPAGFACSLQAKANDLSFVTLEQETLGGTVAKYPRAKLVMTQPVELPLHGRLKRTSFVKEELVELWHELAARHELPIRTGVRFEGLARADDGSFTLRTSGGTLHARCVALALGRRGSPRKLEVPGEELSKVVYALVDAQSYQGRNILVVGGGDSAIEAALALSEQPGNKVSLSYRNQAFFRIKPRNEEKIGAAQTSGAVQVLFRTQVRRIGADSVELALAGDDGPRELVLPNDAVFVLAGGIPPFELLEKCGVSFDPAARPRSAPRGEQGAGLPHALAWAAAYFVLAAAWAIVQRDYYLAPLVQRPDSPAYDRLNPSGSVGLVFGGAALAAMLLNLAYLLRRSPRFPLSLGSLRSWMTLHVATGIAALCLALLHSGLAPRHTPGGHALLGLLILVVSGALGRYLYSFVPRAANGRELELDEVRAELARVSAEWERADREFGERVQREIGELVARGVWRRSLPGRLLGLLGNQLRLARWLGALEGAGREAGLAPTHLAQCLALARRAHESSLGAARYEELRALLASWRYLHRWIALLVVLLVAFHVFVALRYGSFLP